LRQSAKSHTELTRSNNYLPFYEKISTLTPPKTVQFTTSQVSFGLAPGGPFFFINIDAFADFVLGAIIEKWTQILIK